MESTVMNNHIKLYVNKFTLNLGKDGKKAITELYRIAGEKGIIPEMPEQIFLTAIQVIKHLNLFLITLRLKLKDLVLKTRSYRRFDESHRIDYRTLEDLVDLARLSASGANRQPLKFLIYNSPEDCARVFPSVVWAAYLKEWDGPGTGERPSGYIIILGDKIYC